MKKVINFLIGGMIVLGAQGVRSQSADDSRMTRDIEIAENILSTLIKQEFGKVGNLFPMQVNGTYREGYGVTFYVPVNFAPMVYGKNDFVILDGTPGAYSYSFSTSGDLEEEEGLAVLEREEAEKEKAKAQVKKEKAEQDKVKSEKEKAAVSKERAAQGMNAPKKEDTEYRVARGGIYASGTRTTKRDDRDRDSLTAVNNARIIQASKNFLADYGDLLGLLKADEKIIITNKDNNQRWYYSDQSAKRSILIVEATKGDVAQYRQGKITRDGLLSKIKVTNTESTGKMEPDLELLASIFNRLYSSDLSTSYYLSGNSYYERLTDFGAIVYMQVYSSNETDGGLFNMPTVDLRRVERDVRDKKVKELYPTFESELKENILEYGRTVRSLKDNEQLVFNVILTKCKGCGIPADLEVSVPYTVLKDYNSGKLDKNSALTKVIVKKGAAQ